MATSTVLEGAAEPSPQRKKVVVVGLGMVGIAFIEKLLKLDSKRRQYDIVVIGEEPHLAYNRVGLTSFFQDRKIESLYINPIEWYSQHATGSLSYHLNSQATEINREAKVVVTADGKSVPYDILVLATGSDALLPKHTPGHDARGVFVYRTIDDLQKLIAFGKEVKGTTCCVVGGGLLGLEAAKAMMDLDEFKDVKLIERNGWVLSRQLDGEAGSMVVELVRKLGLDVMLRKRVREILTNDQNGITGVIFEDGDEMECSCIVFAIGIKARDELARKAGLRCPERGSGVTIDNDLRTSDPNIYAIGECASWENQTFGLIAPGVEQADVLAFNLTQAKDHSLRTFKRPDLSTKLKLLGVEVASFGDFFADRDGPKDVPGRRRAKIEETPNSTGSGVPAKAKGSPASDVKALTYKDPFQAVYKKYLFTMDGKYLLGGMMIGDTSDYVKLVPMVKNKKQLEIPPRDVVAQVKSGKCTSIGDVKSCTKAGTGCGGCMPLVQGIFNKTMKELGQTVLNHMCPHFEFSRADIYNIIYVKKLKTFGDVMRDSGVDPESAGCEVCKPAIASILASMFNKHILEKPLHGLQDTNDKYLGNIQRNGTFSVIPRVAGGEITPDKLIVIGQVAKKYGLYTKITGGQRIDMFGAKKTDLLGIWTELVAAGLESGHAYAKSLRTVKSCVGTTWCRFGIGDSVGLAVRLEERYKSIRSPHKLKGGVSGCVRECAEAQNKDFGCIATEKGYNIFVGGNGGATPKHSELLAKDVPPDDVITILDRYLMFYIRTADRLQRTARWVEGLPGGIKYLREVVLEDKLGICAELEKQMQELVGTFFCEWTETINDAEKRKAFDQFANSSEERDPAIEKVVERGQSRPAYWAKESVLDDFKGTKWTSLAWQPIVEANKFADVDTGSSQTVIRGDTQLAVFKVKGKYYASQQMCPHRRTFGMSDGLIGEVSEKGCKEKNLYVSCPYHKRNFQLNGEVDLDNKDKGAGSCSNDSSMSLAIFPAEEREDGWVYLKLPPVTELDNVLGTARWVVKANEREDPFANLDKQLGLKKGLRGTKMSSVSGRESVAAARPIAVSAEKRIDCLCIDEMRVSRVAGTLLTSVYALLSCSSAESVCSIDPESTVSDACASYASLERLNQQLGPALEDVTQKTDFFSYYRLNLYSKVCPFWSDESSVCGNRACAVDTIEDESAIPEIWRAEELSKLKGMRATHPGPEQQKERPKKRPLQYQLGENVDETCVLEEDDEFDARDYCLPEDEGAAAKGDYVSLVNNTERFTGYSGPGPHQVWDAIYRENCFAPRSPPPSQTGSRQAASALQNVIQEAGRVSSADDSGLITALDDECLEQRAFYRVISGMHTSISTHLCWDYFNQKTGEWFHNVTCYKDRLHSHPERISNLYFNFALVTRAVAKLRRHLEHYTFCSGDPDLDYETKHKVLALAARAAAEPNTFDESVMFTTPELLDLKDSFKQRFRNVSRLMDCVGCDKCRLWGKVQTAGYGAALKVLFEFDETKNGENPALRRTELVALINTWRRISHSLYAIDKLRALVAEEESQNQSKAQIQVEAEDQDDDDDDADGMKYVNIDEIDTQKLNRWVPDPTFGYASKSQGFNEAKLTDDAKPRHSWREDDRQAVGGSAAAKPSDSSTVSGRSLKEEFLDEFDLVWRAYKMVLRSWYELPFTLGGILVMELNRLWHFFIGLPVPEQSWQLDWSVGVPRRDEL
ncbi:hypothetical protein DV737_g4144, partial [Chaetothyriales sp. CBS 132003]